MSLPADASSAGNDNKKDHQTDDGTKVAKDGIGVLEVKHLSEATHVAHLWAGYGSVQSLQAQVAETKGPTTLSLMTKLVQPKTTTTNDDEANVSESHVRKIESYHVEASFYRVVAPQIAKWATATTLAMPRAYWIQTPHKNNVAPKEEEEEEEEEEESIFSKKSRALLAQRLGLSSFESDSSAFVFVLSDLRVHYPVVGSSMSCGLNWQQTQTALSWLAQFHALFWRRQSTQSPLFVVPEGAVWEQGTYWYWATRQSEWQKSLKHKDADWRFLAQAAPALDQVLRTPSAVTTLLHGDFKQANLLFNASGTSCAAVDFQYTGWGCGMKEVVRLVVSSVEPSVLDQQGEEGLLQFYLSRLKKALPPTPLTNYPWRVALAHYELSLLDYVRFLSGWGWRGINHASYAQPRARRLVQELQSAWKRLLEKKNNKNDKDNMTEEEAWQLVVQEKFATIFETTNGG